MSLIESIIMIYEKCIQLAIMDMIDAIFLIDFEKKLQHMVMKKICGDIPSVMKAFST